MLSAATLWGVTSADAQIVIDGHFADWDGINTATMDDAKDMADSSGDIRQIQAHVEGGNLHLSMTVHGFAAPSIDDTTEGMKNRYYYHWLVDTDNDTATGFKTDAYEGNSTGLAKPLGVDLIVQFGWRDGKRHGWLPPKPDRQPFGEYGNGAVMSFADGRAERWGWQSTHPFMRGKPRDEAIPDLRRI